MQRIRKPSNQNPVVNALGLGLMSAVGLVWMFYAALPDYRQSGALESSGKSAEAQIQSVTKKAKGGLIAHYSFEARNQEYTGESDYKGSIDDTGPVTISYLPSDPTFSAISPADKLAGARFLVIFLFFWCLIPCVGFVSALRKIIVRTR